MKRDDFRRTVELWTRVVQNLKERLLDFTGANIRLGEYHLRRGNIQDAQFRYRLVTRLNPCHADAWAGLAMACFAEGDDGQAKECAQRALRLQPAHPQAAPLLAEIARLRAEATTPSREGDAA